MVMKGRKNIRMSENTKKIYGKGTLPRTDLAMELRESFEEDDVEIKGVILEEEYNEKDDIKVTTVEIKDEKGAAAMGKPIGSYITIESKNLDRNDGGYNEAIANEIEKHIKNLVGDVRKQEVLVVGLGNREVTPDALGPWVVDNLFITRHLINEYGDDFRNKYNLGCVSAIAPGVMAQTGMETSEIIKGVIKETKPKVVIAIDALAARNTSRVNKTVQLTDTGISPGAGVGNIRKVLNEETLGVKVIGVGCPTVVQASTIVNDTLEKFMEKQGLSEEEVYQFINEVNQEPMETMFVTPKNVDEAVKRISFTISEALNQCFS